jgi:hypothetical protein
LGTVNAILRFISLGISFFTLAQESEAIPWEASRKLQWEDFRGKPFKTAWAAATTASGISYSFTGRERANGYELEFEVHAFFYPEKSWYQPQLCNDAVLRHEQIHFDISELYARKLKAKLAAARFTSNAKAEVKAIYEVILAELHKLQSQYDYETNYSRDAARQQAWEKQIGTALGERF